MVNFIQVSTGKVNMLAFALLDVQEFIPGGLAVDSWQHFRISVESWLGSTSRFCSSLKLDFWKGNFCWTCCDLFNLTRRTQGKNIEYFKIDENIYTKRSKSQRCFNLR